MVRRTAASLKTVTIPKAEYLEGLTLHGRLPIPRVLCFFQSQLLNAQSFLVD